MPNEGCACPRLARVQRGDYSGHAPFQFHVCNNALGALRASAYLLTEPEVARGVVQLYVWKSCSVKESLLLACAYDKNASPDGPSRLTQGGRDALLIYAGQSFRFPKTIYIH